MEVRGTEKLEGGSFKFVTPPPQHEGKWLNCPRSRSISSAILAARKYEDIVNYSENATPTEMHHGI